MKEKLLFCDFQKAKSLIHTHFINSLFTTSVPFQEKFTDIYNKESEGKREKNTKNNLKVH